MGQSLVKKLRITEFDWLKILALLLIVFVHSDLFFVFPEIIFPTEWFLVSCFFFVSGFLAYNSLHKRGSSVRKFLKSKILSLYIPFVAISIFYSILQSIIGKMPLNVTQVLSQITLFNIFDVLNSSYNWDFLWFIPYLLIFMIFFCFIEKYIPNPKWQFLLVSSLWLLTIFLWVVDFSLKLGQVFSQYFLIFIVGFWLNKFSIYQKVTRLRVGLIMVPLVALFTVDLSNFFNFNTATETLKYLLYSNGRSIIFSLAAVLLVLIILREVNIPSNLFVTWVATISILIYFMDPLFNYLISNYIFRQPIIYFSAGLEFWIYILFRIVALFVIFPFTVKAIYKLFIRIRLSSTFNGNNNKKARENKQFSAHMNV